MQKLYKFNQGGCEQTPRKAHPCPKSWINRILSKNHFSESVAPATSKSALESSGRFHGTIRSESELYLYTSDNYFLHDTCSQLQTKTLSLLLVLLLISHFRRSFTGSVKLGKHFCLCMDNKS